MTINLLGHTTMHSSRQGGKGARGAGEEGEEQAEQGERRRGRCRGDERRAVLLLLFPGEGDKGALASSSPILGDDMMDPDLKGGIRGEGGEWGGRRELRRR